jgi:hypothetical protein
MPILTVNSSITGLFSLYQPSMFSGVPSCEVVSYTLLQNVAENRGKFCGQSDIGHPSLAALVEPF